MQSIKVKMKSSKEIRKIASRINKNHLLYQFQPLAASSKKPLKKEYLSMMLMRGHKRVINRMTSKKTPKKLIDIIKENQIPS